MSIRDLPDELIQILSDQWPCRDLQLRQLSILLSPTLPSPAMIVVQGPCATGKSAVLEAYLRAIDLPFVMIRRRECVTERHLLEQTIRAVKDAVVEPTSCGADRHRNSKCETLDALVSHLQDLLGGLDHFVLVLDGVDKQREATLTLQPALARLGEIGSPADIPVTQANTLQIPNLTTVLVVQDSFPGAWRRPGVPHISFPAYSRDQSIHIVSRTPLDIFTKSDPAAEGYSDDLHEEDKTWLWPRFCAAVWDSTAQSAARDLTSFSDLCLKLWKPFVMPIVKGDLGTRDFSRLMVMQRKLFQHENVLLDHIVDAEDSVDLLSSKTRLQLPYYAKWLLVAAFLASTNPARLDAFYFMKSTEKRRRKKGGGATRSAGKASNKVPRHLLAPTPFHLDRLLAILHAILPDDLRSNIDVYTQVTTLTSLRLLARSAVLGLGDAIEAGSKWKIGPAVTWELISSIAGSLDFAILDYMAV